MTFGKRLMQLRKEHGYRNRDHFLRLSLAFLPTLCAITKWTFGNLAFHFL